MNERCADPCPGSCGLNARCHVINHVSICTCNDGYEGDPFSGCTKKQSQGNVQYKIILIQNVTISLIILFRYLINTFFLFVFQIFYHSIYATHRHVDQTQIVIMENVIVYKDIMAILISNVDQSVFRALNVKEIKYA